LIPGSLVVGKSIDHFIVDRRPTDITRRDMKPKPLRPQNVCKECNYTWYPRGKNVSLQCPNCDSYETTTRAELDKEIGQQQFDEAIEFLVKLFTLIVSIPIAVITREWKWLSDLNAEYPFQFLCKLLLITTMIVGFLLSVILVYQNLRH
jgi:predicted RNA-binding Zn-ribbon protein involved in translation (DUF1610 family)